MNCRKTNILLLLGLLSVFTCITACEKEMPENGNEPDKEQQEKPNDDPEQEPEDEIIPLVTNVHNPNSEKLVSYRGETITVKFDASAAWKASLVLKTTPEKEWVAITSKTEGTAKKGCSVRMAFEKNSSEEDRVVELWVEGEGYEPSCIAILTQAASGTSSSARLNETLNSYMHEILKENYLFKDAYNAKDVDLTVDFTDFLNTHLLALGEVNEEDGGYYKMHQASPGERYIYSSIQEVMNLQTKSAVTGGFGFGPFLSTALDASANPVMGITPAYVRKGSPAESAGLRRGDIIYKVNGTTLNMDNYLDYMGTLTQEMSGTYAFEFLRDVNGEFMSYMSEPVTAGIYDYNPVLHSSVLGDSGIGYLVYESFDYYSQEHLEEAVNNLKASGIKELVLDLSFNSGGSVAQARWLAGCIAGAANGRKTFANAVYADGSNENWTFDYGYTNDVDDLGLPVDLGLKRVYVVCSYNTASAAELIISSLKGIDFDIRTIGSCTEGKNVGMTVTETTAGGRRFQFSPVTFRLYNAKGWCDYADGIVPDAVVNNDNGVIDDDYDYLFPYSFADWGDVEHRSPLQVAVLDILGASENASAAKVGAKSAYCPRPVAVQPLKREPDRYGNLVYKHN